MACLDEKAMGSSLTTEPFLAIESHRSSEQAVWGEVYLAPHIRPGPMKESRYRYEEVSMAQLWRERVVGRK